MVNGDRPLEVGEEGLYTGDSHRTDRSNELLPDRGVLAGIWSCLYLYWYKVDVACRRVSSQLPAATKHSLSSAMTQPCAFVDPSSLSLPSSSLSRFPSPVSSADSPSHTDEPPRKRPRSAVTQEERKEARAHRNRIAAQNSRDRRKAQFTYLERRVAELEDENRRLRAGILTPAPPVPEPDTTTIEREREQQRKREEGQRERENQELRERIRTLEMGYEAVVRALATQGNLSVASSIPTPPATSPVPSTPSHIQSSPPASSSESSDVTSPASLNAASLSSAPSLPHSPSSSSSTLIDAPLLFSSSDSFEFPQSPALTPTDTSLALSQESLDLSLASNTPTRHLARVVNTVGRPAVSLQRVGGAQMAMGLASTRCWPVMRPRCLLCPSVFSSP